MATSVQPLLFDFSTTGNLQSANGLRNVASLVTVGGLFQQTADTGQINWNTVTFNAANNTIYGYEMFKMVDGLSSTSPFYLKLRYGNGNGAFSPNSYPTIRFSFGSSTDGAGNLMGNVSSEYLHDVTNQTGGPGGPTLGEWYSSSDGKSYLSMIAWANNVNSNASFSLVIERARNSNGIPIDNYVTWFLAYRNSPTIAMTQRSMFKPTMGAFSTELSNAFTLFLNQSTGGSGTFACPFPVFPYLGYPDNPMTSIMGMKSGDIVEGAQFQVLTYGVSHNYYWSIRGPVALGAATGLTNIGIGIRYD